MPDQQDPKDFEKIEKHLKVSGLNANTIAQRMKQAREDSAAFALELKEANDHFANLNRDFNDLTAQFKNVLDDLKGWNRTAGLVNKSFDKIGDIAEKLKNDAKGFSDLNKKDLAKLQEKAKIELDSLKTRKEELELKFKNLSSDRISEISQQSTNKNLAKEAAQLIELRGLMEDNGDLKNDENNYVKTLLSLLDERIDKEKQYEKATGLTGNALKALSKIPGLESLKTEEAANDMREFAKKLQEEGEDITSTSSRLKIAGKGLSTAFKGLTETLLDPVTLMVKLVQLGLKADKQVTELGKSFGVSKEAAGRIRTDVAEFANLTGDTFINTDRLLKAQTELSDQLGLAVKFSNEELATFAKLTELTGLSAEEAGKLAGNAAAAGMSTEAYTDSIREGAFSAMVATKTHFSQKEIMKDISKLSAGTLAKFQGNPKALAAAVVEAKKLGTNLETVNKIGDSLLNFESSIENELKAELMTGKQLNLERARAAALSGDQLSLTREIQSQVGTLNDFQHMNVLAQQSLAEAFGMSRDEMADMLMKQEAVAKYGEEAATLNKEQLEEMKRRNMSAAEYLQYQEQQRSAQDKFADAMTKLQGLIANLVDGPVGDLLDALANIVGFAMKLLVPFGLLIRPIAWIADKLLAFVSTPLGGIIAGLTAIFLLSGKIALGFGGAWKSIKGMGSSITGMFKGGKGGFVENIKESFKKGLAGKDKTKEVAEKGAEGAEKTSEAADKAKGGNAEGFKTRMQNIAEGIKAFADGKVIKGAITLPFAGVGLLLFAPGVIGIKAVEKVNGEKFQEAMYGIAYGIADFGKNVTAGAILKLTLAGVALDLFALGAPGLFIISKISGESVEKSLGGIGRGIASFSNAIDLGKAFKAALAIGLLGASIIPFVFSMKMLAEIDPVTILLGIGAIAALAGVAYLVSKASTDMIIGSVAIAILGVALIPFTYALSLLANVKMENILAAAAGLLIFGAAVFGLGLIMSSGIGAMIFGAGILALIALGGAMIILGIGLKEVSEGGKGVAQLFNDLSQLDADKLDAIAPALKSIGQAVLYLGAGGVMSAIGKLLGGDSPAQIIKDIAASSGGIVQAASGLQSMAGALQQVSSALATIDVSKLEALSDFSDKQSGGIIGRAVSGITDFITSPIKAVGDMMGEKGGKGSLEEVEKGQDLTPVITAINEVKAAVDKLYAKDSTIKMDSTKVGTTLTQGSYKVA